MALVEAKGPRSQGQPRDRQRGGWGWLCRGWLKPLSTNIIGSDPSGLRGCGDRWQRPDGGPMPGPSSSWRMRPMSASPCCLAVRQGWQAPPLGPRWSGWPRRCRGRGRSGAHSCVASRGPPCPVGKGGMNGAGSITGSLGRILPCPIKAGRRPLSASSKFMRGTLIASAAGAGPCCGWQRGQP